MRWSRIRSCADFFEGFAAEPPVLPEAARLDEILNPADLIHVVDADSSQTRVIETVRAGRNLVVHGPPGTGKSQTITNIIAAAVHDGKRFFRRRENGGPQRCLRPAGQGGLDDICLELHSRAANKRLLPDRWIALCKRPPASATDETARQLTRRVTA